jgi:predicted alpha/beta-fold hydrolase
MSVLIQTQPKTIQDGKYISLFKNVNFSKIWDLTKTFSKFLVTKSIKYFPKIAKYSFIIIILFLFYKQLPFKNKSKILYLENENNKKILEVLGNIDYTPSFYMPTCNLQLIYHQLSSRPDMIFERNFINTDDGGLFSMDWVVDPITENSFERLLVILPGINGGTETGYMREIIQGYVETQKYKIVIIHNRGISGTPLLTPKPFHASFTCDLKLALSLLRSKYPDKFCCAMGISMGANIFVKFFSQFHNYDDYIKCFISISNPFNFVIVEQNLRGTFLDSFLRNSMVKYIDKHEVLQSIDGMWFYKLLEIDYEKIKKTKSFREVDEHFTIKIHKQFSSVEDYYFKSSCCHDLDDLKINSFFINAKDDIFSPVNDVDLKPCKIFNFILVTTNPNLMMLLTDTGGHVTFYHGIFTPKRWFIEKSKNYIDAIYHLGIEKNSL